MGPNSRKDWIYRIDQVFQIWDKMVSHIELIDCTARHHHHDCHHEDEHQDHNNGHSEQEDPAKYFGHPEYDCSDRDWETILSQI